MTITSVGSRTFVQKILSDRRRSASLKRTGIFQGYQGNPDPQMRRWWHPGRSLVRPRLATDALQPSPKVQPLTFGVEAGRALPNLIQEFDLACGQTRPCRHVKIAEVGDPERSGSQCVGLEQGALVGMTPRLQDQAVEVARRTSQRTWIFKAAADALPPQPGLNERCSSHRPIESPESSRETSLDTWVVSDSRSTERLPSHQLLH
jgi:hypothetical protein